MSDAKKTVGRMLADLGKIYDERGASYGDNYLWAGKRLSGYFPRGITLDSEEKFNRFHLFVHMDSKLSRYAQVMEKGGYHADSLDDLAVYSQMLREFDEMTDSWNEVEFSRPAEDPPEVLAEEESSLGTAERKVKEARARFYEIPPGEERRDAAASLQRALVGLVLAIDRELATGDDWGAGSYPSGSYQSTLHEWKSDLQAEIRRLDLESTRGVPSIDEKDLVRVERIVPRPETGTEG
jgi:hypothetical protein